MAIRKTPKTKIKFAIVSIRAGRADIRRRLERGEKIQISLEGTLSGVWSRDDGIDQEFSIDVTAHELG